MHVPSNTFSKVFRFITDLLTIILIWIPLSWFVSEHRTAPGWHDGEPALSFEVMSMEWPDIALFFFLCAASFLSQIRFIRVSQDLARYEDLKRRHEEVQAILRQQLDAKL